MLPRGEYTAALQRGRTTEPLTNDGFNHPVELSDQSVRPDALARELTGDLRCAKCGYNLKGLSVRSVCPECGLAIPATVLAKVDPHAAELRPIVWRVPIALGLVVWAAAGLLAACILWLLRTEDLATLFGVSSPIPEHVSTRLGDLSVVLVGISGLGAIAFVRPHAGIPARQILWASLAVAAYVPLVLALHRLVSVFNIAMPTPYFGPAPVSATRVLLRLAIGACVLLIVLGIRPNARLLVARSMLMRSGKVDRQTLYGVAGAVGVTMLGDLIHLASTLGTGSPGSITRLAGTALIGVGSLLTTLGLLGLLIDGLRIMPAIIATPLSEEDVIGPRVAQEFKPHDRLPRS